MKNSLRSFLLCSLLLPFYGRAEFDAWPQWRGAERNGQGLATLQGKLDWSENEPSLLWDSPELPSQDDGGFGSPVSDGRRVYLSIVWHRGVPTEERTVTSLVLRKLGARKVNLPERLVQLAETDRMNLSPRLRGSKLEEWIEQWLDRNLDQKQLMTQGSLLASRFKQGKLAIPLEAIDRLFAIKDQVFADQRALDEWIGKQGSLLNLLRKSAKACPPPNEPPMTWSWLWICAMEPSHGKPPSPDFPPVEPPLPLPASQTRGFLPLVEKESFALIRRRENSFGKPRSIKREWPAPSLLRWEDFCLNRKFASLRREVRSLALGKQAGQRKHRFPRTLENRQFHPDRL